MRRPPSVVSRLANLVFASPVVCGLNWIQKGVFLNKQAELEKNISETARMSAKLEKESLGVQREAAAGQRAYKANRKRLEQYRVPPVMSYVGKVSDDTRSLTTEHCSARGAGRALFDCSKLNCSHSRLAL
jgi:hypothetical protein